MPSEARQWESPAPEDVKELQAVDERVAEDSRAGDPLGPAIGIVTCLIAGAAVWIGVFVALNFR